MSRIALLTVGLFLIPGCFRLSDPFYAGRELRADEPTRLGMSLIFGTIVAGELGAGELEAVRFARTGPGGRQSHYTASINRLFRAFSRRPIKGGHFVLEVPPGVYELESFGTDALDGTREWRLDPEVRESARLVVTRPGVYDMGMLVVAREPGETGFFFGRRMFTWSVDLKKELTSDRQAALDAAIAGTGWAALASRSRRAHQPGPGATPTATSE